MTPRGRALGVLTLVAAFGAVAGCERPAPASSVPEDSPESDRGRSVILIVVDTLRADRLAAERNDTPVMPSLSDFADQSRYFTNAVSQSSWTKPAMVSLFTSLYPQVHNVLYAVVNDDGAKRLITSVVPTRLELLQTYLKSHGYTTAAVQSNGMLEGIGFERDFERYHFENYTAGFRADSVTEKALEFVEAVEAPFFLYVHYMDPHARYAPPLHYQRLFEPLPTLERQDVELLRHWQDYYWDQWLTNAGIQPERKMAKLSEAGRERLRALYDGEARFIDHELNRLLRAVQRRFPDALIVVTADHGEELWEHGAVGHARTVYDELIHVPLIVHGPGIAARETNDAVELIDVVPTIAGVIGLPASEQWQGRDLLASHGTALTQNQPQFSYNRTARKAPGIEQHAVRREEWKLIHVAHKDEWLLFNLAADPGEQANLVDKRPDHVAELRALLEAHRAESAAHPLQSDQESQPFLDEETQEAIRALGYIPD